MFQEPHGPYLAVGFFFVCVPECFILIHVSIYAPERGSTATCIKKYLFEPPAHFLWTPQLSKSNRAAFGDRFATDKPTPDKLVKRRELRERIYDKKGVRTESWTRRLEGMRADASCSQRHPQAFCPFGHPPRKWAAALYFTRACKRFRSVNSTVPRVRDTIPSDWK